MLGRFFTGSLEQKAHRLTEQELGGNLSGYGPGYREVQARNFMMLQFAEQARSPQQRWTAPDALSDEEMVRHVFEALSGFWRAIQLEQAPGAKPAPQPPPGPGGGAIAAPREGLYQLGLASLLEQFADWKSLKPPEVRFEVNPTPPGTAKEGNAFPPTVSVKQLHLVDHREARDAYLIAFRSGFRADRLLARKPISGLGSLVSVEAGHGFLRLATKDPEASTAGTEISKAVAEVKAGLAEVARLPFGAITPIIFPLVPTASIDTLLAPDAVVDFDLRGYGPAERWPWVKPHTAILVWDPLRTAGITSAHQLFGSYTFEIFQENGYEALAALDDNRDGVLRGEELAGIRAWLDSNGDGRSNPSEVRDLSELGIAAIEVRATTSEGPHPMNPRGIHLKNGGTLPTWDWMAEPLPSPPHRNREPQPRPSKVILLYHQFFEAFLWLDGETKLLRQSPLPAVEAEELPGLQFPGCGDVQDVESATADAAAVTSRPLSGRAEYRRPVHRLRKKPARPDVLGDVTPRRIRLSRR